MPRKKKNSAKVVTPRSPVNSNPNLINNLTVADARHLLNNEGEIDVSSLVMQLVSITVVAAFTAWALWMGTATLWHLALPMVAEYLALLVALPLIYPFVRLEGMRKDARNALVWLVAMVTIAVISANIHALREGTPWRDQLRTDAEFVWQWVSDAHMHWPMAAAAAAILWSLPRRVANLKKFGPPFCAVGLGCGMRVGVLILGFFLLPVIVSGSMTRAAWVLWGLIILAEVLALWMQWDIQGRIRKLDGTSKPSVSS